MKIQRNAQSPRLVLVRAATREDFALLQVTKPAYQPSKLRDAHHAMARFAASGMKPVEIARHLGYSEARVSILLNSPAMTDLITRYRAEVHESWRESADQYMDYIYSNGLKAARQISEHLDKADEEGELLPLNRLIAISADSADRVGYTKKSTNINVNVDFARHLEEANRRRKELEAKRLSEG